ncbi:outer membrane beta-barrel protein [Vibrio harveyi]|uniref:outer membrane beta-barrel protein n=1 Tax=Vibrio harveyi group TaxID=717610 RepID=UPI000971B64D|nr:MULTISPECIES: outer membrane beta-barrel protein [Vibrio harveyi group]APX10086.1 hypothetical protein BWP24_28265 [Vibrio campbellii]ELY1989214.1 outer membrane beta-barrel protein [Vibrio harveyi]WCP78852.1 outer membrane beta-barrel protein [Vibrio parahaemolyticus]
MQMKKVLAIAVLAAVSASPAFAAKRINPQTDGASIHAGIGHSSGSATQFVNETNTATIGASYTFSNGQYVNLGYTPSLGSLDLDGVKASLETPTVNILGGYQFRSGIRLFGGASVVMLEAEVNGEKYNDEYFGLTVGGGYLFANNVSIDLQTTFVNIEQSDLANTTISLGYKF